MKFTELYNTEDPAVKEIHASYTESFPPDERRNEEQFQALFHTPEVRIISISMENTRIGYLIVWLLNGYTYLEHFEVFINFRNRKFGAEILTKLRDDYPKMVLESEPENHSEIASRRLCFYQRNGYSIIDKNYIQPSYGPGKNPMPLYLLANFEIKDSQIISQEIHQKVYGAYN